MMIVDVSFYRLVFT